MADLAAPDRVRAWMELNPVPSTVAEIASGAGVTAAAVTTVLGLVADAGHLETSGRPGDARYRLTPANPNVVTRAQQQELDPILNQAATYPGLGPTDLVMSAYNLGRTHASPVRLDDLRALLAAIDSDALSTDNLPALEERIGRLYAACEEP